MAGAFLMHFMALQKIGATGEKLKSVGSSIKGAGKKLMPVTAAVGGLGAAAVKVASDFDFGMSKVAAVSGAAGTELDKLREKAREMGTKTKFSASEAAEAIGLMANAGIKSSQAGIAMPYYADQPHRGCDLCVGILLGN